MFDEQLKELRSQLASADTEKAALLAADIARLERAAEIEAELGESPVNTGGRARVRPQRADETETEFRARAERELARVELD